MNSSRQEKRSYDGDQETQLPLYHSEADDESSLPLYNSSENATKPPIPDKTATPAEVRDFITQLLIVTRSLTETHAREIADKWILGSGDELLRTYPAQMYREIFGSESGWMVYKEVMLHRYETEHPERDQRRHGCIGLAVTIPIFVAVILLGQLCVNHNAWLLIYPVIFTGLFDVLGCVIFFIMAVAPQNTALGLVEGKLKDTFFKGSQSGSSS